MAEQLLQITPSETPQERPSKWKQRVLQGLALFIFAALPAWLCQYFVDPPQDRHIHVEAFRYGKNPSVIHANWGDRLHLTFSTKDTGHSFFLEEFNIDAKISPGNPNIAVFRTDDPEAPPTFQREVVIEAKHDGWFGWLVSRSQFRCHVWCGPMHAFEHGNIIIAPNRLLYAGYGLLFGIPLVALVSLRPTLKRGWAQPPATVSDIGWDLFERFPWMKTVIKQRWFQVVFLSFGMALMYVVVVTSAFGTHVAGRNLGIMLMWVVWMFFLAAVLTPLGGAHLVLGLPIALVGRHFTAAHHFWGASGQDGQISQYVFWFEQTVASGPVQCLAQAVCVFVFGHVFNGAGDLSPRNSVGTGGYGGFGNGAGTGL